VAWYTDYSFISQRAVAWTSGEFNQGTCKWENADVWTGATADAINIQFKILDGDSGVEQDSVQIGGTTGYMERSPYGAAVDPDNNLWAVNGYCGGTLVFVNYSDLSYELITPPNEVCAYGITVDSQGFVWIGGYQTYSGRYDPVGQTWDLVQAQGLGIQEDGQGRLWLGAYGQNGVYAIDGDTLQVLSYTAVPTTGQSKGVAIDFFGYVWVVSDAGTTAVRLDPDTLEIQTYAGLNEPYSYSDMTGWGLKNTSGDPQG
jgi:ligand-binding sensor domain-containing protein